MSERGVAASYDELSAACIATSFPKYHSATFSKYRRTASASWTTSPKSVLAQIKSSPDRPGPFEDPIP